MKVILLQQVDNLGDIGDIVEVANGYGRNYLVPRGLATAATAKNKRELEHQQRLRRGHRRATRPATLVQIRPVECVEQREPHVSFD